MSPIEERLIQAESAVSKVKAYMLLIRGAQFDLLNGRNSMEIEEEISASLASIEEALEAVDVPAKTEWEVGES